MFHPVRGSWRWPMIYRKSYRITQKLIWWRVSKSFRGTLSSHDNVRENFGKATRPVSSILERTRSRVMRMAASKISWFNFPSVATRDNFVRDSPTGNGGWPNVKCTKLRAIPFSLSLRPYLRWKMFYDQTLGSPFKQHIANPTAESSDDRTWQNIVAKPSSCISVSPPPLLSLQLIYRDRRVKIGEGQMFPDVCR